MEDPFVIPLGVGAALSGPNLANCYLAVGRRERYWLVDCADSPVQRLERAGLDPLALQGIFLTHFHPDHVYGLPVLLLDLCLLNRERPGILRTPVRIFARPEVLAKAQALMALFEPEQWNEMFPISYEAVEPEIGAVVTTDDDFVITAAPTRHLVPSLAVKFALSESGRALVYSSDTEPCAGVEALAQGSALLIHEATDFSHGHSHPEDAARLAERAGVERLILIHYEPGPQGLDYLLKRARSAFSGPVDLAEELRWYFWSVAETSGKGPTTGKK